MWKSVQAKQNANFKWSASLKKKLLDPTECIKGGCTNVVFDAQVSIVLYFNMHVTHDDEGKEQSVEGTLYQRQFRNKMVLWGVWPALFGSRFWILSWMSLILHPVVTEVNAESILFYKHHIVGTFWQ